MISPLNKKLEQVKWGEFKLGDLFDIRTTSSFDSNNLTDGDEYDYVTRTSCNQGILRKTGFVNQSNINEAGGWSLGLLQMDFFYRNRPWYAGQFVRNIVPKIQLTEPSILFFTTVLNKLKPKLLSVLVRHVDKLFCNSRVLLPITTDHEIDFEFINTFVAELEAERIVELEAYLTVTGLKDFALTEKECIAIEDLNTMTFKEFNALDIFDVKNTSNLLSRDIIENSGSTPYLCASAENNAVSSYISHDVSFLNKGRCVFIGGKTFVVSYQKQDFFSNDSHNLALYLKKQQLVSENVFLGLVTCVNRSLKHKYSWGNSISSKKIKSDVIMLPVKNNKPDFESMEILISAVKKLVIKDVVEYANNKIKAAKQAIAH